MNACLAFVFCVGALLVPRTAAAESYTSRPAGFDTGGGHAVSAHWAVEGSMGGFCGTGRAEASVWTVQHGYASQFNQSPLARADGIERDAQDTSAAILVAQILRNDLDLENDALTVTAVSERSARGAVVTRDGEWIRYTPPTAVGGPDWFTYTVTDRYGDQALAKVYVFVRKPGTPAGETILHVDTDTSKQTGNLLLLVQIPVTPKLVLEASPNLLDWRSILTNISSFEVAEVIGPKLTDAERAFYRARSSLDGPAAFRLDPPLILAERTVLLRVPSTLPLRTHIDRSEDLVRWETVMDLSGIPLSVEFSDHPPQDQRIRFYRASTRP